MHSLMLVAADFAIRLSNLRVLYADSMGPGFLGARAGATTDLTKLCGHVAQLPPAAAAELAQRLRGEAARVWDGEEACALQLEQLTVRPLKP